MQNLTSGFMVQSPIQIPHWAKGLAWPGSTLALDVSAEVGLLDSNVIVRSQDGLAQWTSAVWYRDKFGFRMLVSGPSSARISDASLQYCGQAGLARACLQFESITAVGLETYSRGQLASAQIYQCSLSSDV